MRNRIAVITGANKGIGLAIVRGLARRGMTVVLTARDPKKGQKAIEDLHQEKLSVDFCQLDVTNEESINQLREYLEDRYQKIDVLVNNAGIFLDQSRTTLDLDRHTLRQTLETNLFGPLLVSQALIPLMKKSADGRIINVSSGLGQLSDADQGYPSYSMSKAALNMLSIKMAADLLEANIKVNSVCPGWVKTDMGGPEAPGTVEEGADTVIWLCTADLTPSGAFLKNRKEIAW